MRIACTSFTLCLSLVACARGDVGSTDTAAASNTGSDAQKVGETVGFEVPESVRYDAEMDLYFVSNVNGNPSQKDNNGYISRVRADSMKVTSMLVAGGKQGRTLHAPKGMAIQGDTLWVADIDVLRGFNRRTGVPVRQVSLTAQGATFLNDVTVGGDGAVYVTDTGIRFDSAGAMTHPGVNRVFKVAGTTVTEAARGDSLLNPNGISWDATGNRFILAPFGGASLQSWTPGQQTPANLVSGPGQYDGVEVLSNGNILVSSWADSTVHIVHGGSHMMPLVRNVSAPADIGVDTKRNVLAVPRFSDGKVEYFRIP